MEENRIRTNKNYLQIAPIIESNIDKMVLTDEQIENLNIISYKLQKGSVTIINVIFQNFLVL